MPRLIGRNPAASSLLAPGVWTPNEVHGFRLNNSWPLSPSRFLRLLVTACNGDNWIETQEVKFIVGATNYPTQNMTSNTAPSPLVASASSELLPAYFAFSTLIDSGGGGNSRWHTATGTPPHWIQIDLGVGNEITPNGILITPGATNRSPRDFQVLGSNSGSFTGEQTIYYSASGLTTGWGNYTPRTFSW